MAYKYQQNYGGGNLGDVTGWVKFNVTPDVLDGVTLKRGQTFTVSGQVYCSNDEIEVMYVAGYGPTSDRTLVLGDVVKTVAKGKTGTFSITCTVSDTGWDRLWNTLAAIGEDEVRWVYFHFVVQGTSGGLDGRTAHDSSSYIFRMIENRSPTIEGITFVDRYGTLSDGNTPYQRFGGYVHGKSVPRIEPAYTNETRDAALTVSHVLAITGGTPAQSIMRTATTGYNDPPVTFDLPTPDYTGTLSYTYTVTDSAGLSATATGSIVVYPYAAPAISAFGLVRYEHTVDEGDRASDHGTLLWADLAGSVQEINGKNAWTLSLVYGRQGEDTRQTRQVASGADGCAGNRFAYSMSPDVFPESAGAISAAYAWQFTAVLSDMFHATQRITLVPKAGGYLNVEKNGVAVGMRSTGEQLQKKFEVAEDYESDFYGPVNVQGALKVLGGVGVEPEDITAQVTIAKTSGTASISSFTVTKYGPLIRIELAASGSSSASAGGNFFTGQVSGCPLPPFRWTIPAEFPLQNRLALISITATGVLQIRPYIGLMTSNDFLSIWYFSFYTSAT